MCTRSGLVADIAIKELTTSYINELISNEVILGKKLSQLKISIDLLDSATSLFSPYERESSSRVKLVEYVKNQFL